MEQIYLKCVRVIELDEGIDNTKTEDIYIIKTDDIYISKTEDIDISKTEDIDISKTEDIDISKTEDIDIGKTEDKDEDTDRDRLIWVFRYAKQWHGKKNGNWKRRQIVWVFWNNSHVSELCEKWIYLNGKYAYIRFEELRTHSGEVLFTREHKGTT